MPISNEAFAIKMMTALRKAGVDQELRYVPERFAIVSANGGEFFLASAHQFYNEASFWKRGAVVKHYARTMFNTPLLEYPKTFDAARANILPVVHTTAYLDVAHLLIKTSEHGDAGSRPPRFVPLVGPLCYGLAYDTPLSLGQFPEQQLDDWGVTFEDAMRAAHYNLSVRSRDPMREVVPGLFMAPWEDANASGRMVLTELLTRLPVKGDIVVSVPGRDYLLVAGSDDADALGAMVAVVEKALLAPKAKTPEMFRLQGTEWVAFNLPPAHPLSSKHQTLVKAFLADDYEHQKKLIDQLHQKMGTDMFVATYTAMRRDDGLVYAWCSWAPCVTLLPRTDVIGIFDADAKPGDQKTPLMVPWDAAVEVVGHRMKRQEQYQLERYLVETSPTTSEMAELTKRAVPP